jgi:hypothetical protein
MARACPAGGQDAGKHDQPADLRQFDQFFSRGRLDAGLQTAPSVAGTATAINARFAAQLPAAPPPLPQTRASRNRVKSCNLTLQPRAWARDFNTDRSITPTFQMLPGASFVVDGAAQASDAALVTASAEMKWLNGFSLAGAFEGEFSNVTASYAGKGVVQYAW